MPGGGAQSGPFLQSCVGSNIARIKTKFGMKVDTKAYFMIQVSNESIDSLIFKDLFAFQEFFPAHNFVSVNDRDIFFIRFSWKI